MPTGRRRQPAAELYWEVLYSGTTGGTDGGSDQNNGESCTSGVRMPMYQVLMNAENFLVDLEGTLAKHGFCTSRFVEAASADRAELAAVEMLRNDQDLRAMIKTSRMTRQLST